MQESIEKIEFRRAFAIFTTAHFKFLKESSKLKILPKNEIDEIIKTLDNFDNIKGKTPLQYKWRNM